MIEELIKLANLLDEAGAHKEAEEVDGFIEKISGSQGIRNLSPVQAPKVEVPDAPHKWEQELAGTNPELAKKVMELKDLNAKRIEVMKEIEQLMGTKEAPEEPKLSPEESDVLKLMSSEENLTKVFADLCSLSDELDQAGLAKEANLIDEFLEKSASKLKKQAGPVLPDVMKWKEEDKKTDRSKRYDAEYHNSLQVREPKPTKEKEEHHVHTYQPSKVMSLNTRYCPYHIGVSLGRVGEATYQCPLDGDVYNFELGFKDYQGNEYSGGSISQQTPNSTQYEIPSRIFDSRENVLNVVN